MFSHIIVGDGLARPELSDVGKEIVHVIDYINGRYNGCKIIHFVAMPTNHIHLLIRIAGRASPYLQLETLLVVKNPLFLELLGSLHGNVRSTTMSFEMMMSTIGSKNILRTILHFGRRIVFTQNKLSTLICFPNMLYV
ncbi:MAG: hypothetical protein FWH55_01720 [Oscillospiraceae bacterium]|nr:hypothetical protein [Oscillospiraceae bacterium]